MYGFAADDRVVVYDFGDSRLGTVQPHPAMPDGTMLVVWDDGGVGWPSWRQCEKLKEPREWNVHIVGKSLLICDHIQNVRGREGFELIKVREIRA